MLAAALGYHRREKKPAMWAYYSRLDAPVDEWVDTRGTLIAELNAELIQDWHDSGKQATRQVRLRGRLEPGTTIRIGSSVTGIYEDVPSGANADSLRAFGKDARVTAIDVDVDGWDVIEIDEPAIEGCSGMTEMPMAIMEHTFINDGPLEDAIRDLAERVASATGHNERGPALDILTRRNPVLISGASFDGALSDDPVGSVVHTLQDLDQSYVAVQGPPGTGKTWLGSHVVKELVERGWKVGVVAQGHATIEHFLDKAIEAGVAPATIAKRNRQNDKTTRSWIVPSDNPGVAKFMAGGGQLVGGTAWTFASPKAFENQELDLLVIDEAGQFSLADTIAASRAAKRILMLGDPRQLPQVSQGTHPEPVDGSALGWLMDDSATILKSRGFFLAQTRRMHPALASRDSVLSYEGKLSSVDEVTTGRELMGIEPGVRPMSINHTDNRVQSAEEADAIVETIGHLVSTTWRPSTDESVRPFKPSDVLVVAPYNAQVALIRSRLDTAGYDSTRVGTVDKFQGQEAAVVMVSMTASSPADVPRGMDFLLSRNRLNVAISRGQWAAYVFSSPRLTDFLPSNPTSLAELGAFLRLTS